MRQKFISEVITQEETGSWKEGEVISITAPTGSGKSHFIKYGLYLQAKHFNKKILMLIHRRNCVDQFKMELESINALDSNVIDIRTYQSIESIERVGYKFDLSVYDYIVVDEAHYFLSDAGFNYYTDVSLNRILEEEKAIKIFMTATGDKINSLLEDKKNVKPISYNVEASYSHIKKLRFFQGDNYLYEFVKACIREDLKAIIFTNDVKKAFALHMKFKDNTLFNCSRTNEFYDFVDEDKINDMLKSERFEENVLITTSVMEAGVNIKDSELNMIVTDINDLDVIIQCIGRKRIMNEDDYINLYVKDYTNKQLNGIKSQVRIKLDKVEYYLRNGEEDYVKKYGRSAGNIADTMIYDDYDVDRTVKRVNQLMYFRASMRCKELDDYIRVGFKMFLSKHFEFDPKEVKVIEIEKKKDDLLLHLESVEGKQLLKEDQKVLIEMIDLRDRFNRRQKGIGTLNEYLRENKIGYKIISKVKDAKVKGKRRTSTYWLVVEDEGVP